MVFVAKKLEIPTFLTARKDNVIILRMWSCGANDEENMVML